MPFVVKHQLLKSSVLSQPLYANMPSTKRSYAAALGQLQELLGSMPASASGDRADDRDDDDDDDDYGGSDDVPSPVVVPPKDSPELVTCRTPVSDDEVQDSVVYKYWE